MGANSGSYDYDPSVNGFLLNGKLIPETVLENILSFLCIKDILKLRKVKKFLCKFD